MVGRRPAVVDTVVDYRVAVVDTVTAGHTALDCTAAAAAYKALAGGMPYMVSGWPEPALAVWPLP